MFRKLLKRVGRGGETLLVFGLLRFFSWLPLDMASYLGGKLLRTIGRFTSRHQVVLKNLALVFPEKTSKQRAKIALGMWEHLGRLFAELPFLEGDALTSRISDVQHIPEGSIRPQSIYVSGHFGQWELLNYLAFSKDSKLASVYRHINNVRLDELLRQFRQHYTHQLIRKKGESAIGMVRALSSGMSLSLLVDQRLTSGELLPFLGAPAKTNMAAARLAIKMKLPIVPAFVTRTRGAYFNAEVLPALEVALTGDEATDATKLTLAFNALLEARIRTNPEQYLWVHDRWK